MITTFAYIGAAFAEIGGCFAFWAWARMGKSVWWLPLGVLSLILFAFLLTRVDSDAAGACICGLWRCLYRRLLDMALAGRGYPTDRWDATGAAICLIGTAIILLGPRAA